MVTKTTNAQSSCLVDVLRTTSSLDCSASVLSRDADILAGGENRERKETTRSLVRKKYFFCRGREGARRLLSNPESNSRAVSLTHNLGIRHANKAERGRVTRRHSKHPPFSKSAKRYRHSHTYASSGSRHAMGPRNQVAGTKLMSIHAAA